MKKQTIVEDVFLVKKAYELGHEFAKLAIAQRLKGFSMGDFVKMSPYLRSKIEGIVRNKWLKEQIPPAQVRDEIFRVLRAQGALR